MATVIRTEGITKFYGSHRAVENLDLEVNAGEVFGYLGPNGAGKTTTIRLLLDILRPTRGRVEIFGLDPRRNGIKIRNKIGYLPGDLSLNGRESVKVLLGFLADVRGGVSKKRIDELAERLQLDTSRPLRSLSKGNKQKVGLIQALMHEPELLILDEPTTGLDPLLQQEFIEIVREARTGGQTVFMSSHILTEVQQVADRVGIVRNGRLAAVERVESLGNRAMRSIEILFDSPVPQQAFAGLPGIQDIQVNRTIVKCTVSGRLDPLVKVASKYTVIDLISTEPDLEETFLSYYYDEEDNDKIP